MRIGTGDEFLRLTGGTLTGALTIAANVTHQLLVDRPDGAAATSIAMLSTGAHQAHVVASSIEPKFYLSDAATVVRLSARMDTGLLGTGLIPLSLLRVDEQTAQNAGAVTVLAASTTIADLAQMTVAVGDRIHVNGVVVALKGATAGLSTYGIAYALGTAVVAIGVDAVAVELAHDQLNATTHVFTLSGMFLVTGAGTLTLRLYGRSAGSNSTVAIGNGDFHALVLRG